MSSVREFTATIAREIMKTNFWLCIEVPRTRWLLNLLNCFN